MKIVRGKGGARPQVELRPGVNFAGVMGGGGKAEGQARAVPRRN